jgi:hypothetical protein
MDPSRFMGCSYAPVASWPIMRLILIMSIVLNWSSIQIDYVQAYAQADVETDNVYMNVPKGFELTDGLMPRIG